MTLFIIASAITPTILGAQTVSDLTEITITKYGKTTINGARVMQVIGTSFYIRTNWGKASARWLVRSNDTTKVIGKYDRELSIGDLSVDDIVNIEGQMEGGVEVPNITAKLVRSLSSQIEGKQYTGVVTAIAPETDNITLLTKSAGNITVKIATSTRIKKGTLVIDGRDIRVGDSIINTQGIYDHATKSLSAEQMEVYVDTNLFKPRNFQGKLKSVSGTTLPVTLIVEVAGTEYQMLVEESTEIQNQKRAKVTLRRFVEGDTIRAYGARQEYNLSLIRAEVVRNLDL